LVIM